MDAASSIVQIAPEPEQVREDAAKADADESDTNSATSVSDSPLLDVAFFSRMDAYASVLRRPGVPFPYIDYLPGDKDQSSQEESDGHDGDSCSSAENFDEPNHDDHEDEDDEVNDSDNEIQGDNEASKSTSVGTGSVESLASPDSSFERLDDVNAVESTVDETKSDQSSDHSNDDSDEEGSHSWTIKRQRIE